jgi:hypothetical protein
MKTKFKNALKVVALFSFIVLSSCEKDLYNDAILQSSSAKNHYHLKIKTFTQLNKKKYFVDAYNKSITALKNKSTLQNKLIYGINVDTTFINEVSATNYKSYTFKVIEQVESQTYFKNLIIEIDDQQRVSAEIANYNLDNNSNIQSIESTVIIPKEIDEVISSNNTNKCFYYEIITQTSCGCEGQHYDGEDGCNCPESPPTTTVHMIVDCTGGGDSGGSNSTPGGGGNHQSGIGGGTDDLIITAPVGLTQNQIKTRAFILGLNEQQSHWYFEQDIQTTNAIVAYLVQNSFSPESVDFINWGINYLIANPTTTFEQFQNQFMGTSEGIDGEYDAAYWENPSLTFPPQNLPT